MNTFTFIKTAITIILFTDGGAGAFNYFHHRFDQTIIVIVVQSLFHDSFTLDYPFRTSFATTNVAVVVIVAIRLFVGLSTICCSLVFKVIAVTSFTGAAIATMEGKKHYFMVVNFVLVFAGYHQYIAFNWEERCHGGPTVR